MPKPTKTPIRDAAPPYDWGRGEFMTPKASPTNPDMSKMPQMKPMASHEVGGTRSTSNVADRIRASIARRPVSRKVSR